MKKSIGILVLIFIFLAFYVVLGVQKHNRFETGDDMALNCQAVWLFSQARPPISSFKNANILTDHFALILPVISPIYKLWADARILIIFQQLLIVFSVIPVYLFSEKLLKNRIVSLIFSFLYLYFIGIQSAVSFDFHLATLSAGFLSFTIYFMETKKWKWYFLFMILGMFCKEDVPVYMFMLGVYLVLIKKEKKVGLLTMVVSFVYYYSIFNIFIPRITGAGVNVSPFGPKGSGILQLLFTNPVQFVKNFTVPFEKVRNIILTSFSFGFLPFLSPLYWIAAPATFLRFFSEDVARYSLHFQYTATLTPILAYSSILALKKIKFGFLKGAFLTIAIIGNFYTNRPGLDKYFETPPIARLITRAFYVLPPRNDDYNKILSLIPAGASVSAQVPLLPYLCNRDKLYTFPNNYENVEYIALTFTESPYPLEFEDMEKLRNELLKDNSWENLYQSYAGVLLKKKGR